MTHAQPPTAPDAGETLRLDDALKLAGVAATGGEAKMLIQGGAVRVNGEVETRRKRRLIEGDVIEIGDDSFEIALSDAEEDEEGEDEAPVAARDPDPIPVRAPGAGDLEDEDDEDDEEDEDDDEDDETVEFGGWRGAAGEDDADEDADEDAERLDDDELARWAAWIEERVADGDVEAVIIRLGGLHPDALEAVFALLPAEVEARVLDALDEVLERAAADEEGDAGDRPLQA